MQNHVVQLIGRPRIEWGRRYPRHTTGGTQRYWQLRIEAWRLTTLPAFPHWRFIDYSPHLPRDSEADDHLSNPYSGSRKNLTQEV